MHAKIIPYLNSIILSICLQLVRYIHIRNLSQSYHDIVVFMYDLYLWIRIYVFLISMYFTLCKRTAWKNSLTEWFTLYQIIIFNKKKLPPPPPPPPGFQFSNPFAPPLTVCEILKRIYFAFFSGLFTVILSVRPAPNVVVVCFFLWLPPTYSENLVYSVNLSQPSPTKIFYWFKQW